MPPIRKQSTNIQISQFRSFPKFDKIIDEKTVRCKCGITVRLDCPFRISNFERHIKSCNCILGTDNQQSLYVFFNQSQDTEEDEVESHELLPCIGLFEFFS
ncbi:18839_t:CDS:2 [Funneliformis geosporum]|uniref:18839_t:CDS:1 n=1 Tax=Funneliformis geosporum TaxID=1117311 RepID=A0A9W4SUT8_9GLOM|nr:18839_t:CDS:2 [Funneliformis geosporum]